MWRLCGILKEKTKHLKQLAAGFCSAADIGGIPGSVPRSRSTQPSMSQPASHEQRLIHSNLIISPAFIHSCIHSITGVRRNATKLHYTLWGFSNTLSNWLLLPLVFVGKCSPRAWFHRCIRLPVFQQPTLYEWVMEMSERPRRSDVFIFGFEGVRQWWERPGNSADL